MSTNGKPFCEWPQGNSCCGKKGSVAKRIRCKDGQVRLKYLCYTHDRAYYDKYEDPYREVRHVSKIGQEEASEYVQTLRKESAHKRVDKRRRMALAYSEYDQIIEETSRFSRV